MKKRHVLVLLVFSFVLINGCAQTAITEKAAEERLSEEQQIEGTEKPTEIIEEPAIEEPEKPRPAAEEISPEIREKEEVAEEITVPKKQTTLKFSRKLKVADAIFPGIFFANGNFYMTYNKNNDVYIKQFDENFKEIKEKKLTSVRKVNDIQVVYGNNYFYIVYSTPGKSGKPDGGLYLKKFDLGFNEIKGIAVTKESPKTEATNDMFFSFIKDLLYVGTFYIPPNPADPANSFGHNIRVFDNELNLKSQIVANDLPHQNGASLVFSNNKFTIVSGANLNFNSQNRDLIILNYAQDWSFLNDKVISNEPDDEYWPMGSFFDGDTIYVAYTSKEKFNEQFCPTCDMGEIHLKRFDKDWNFIDKTTVSDKFPSHRAHILKSGNKVYVAYDSYEDNQFKVYVREFVEE